MKEITKPLVHHLPSLNFEVLKHRYLHLKRRHLSNKRDSDWLFNFGTPFLDTPTFFPKRGGIFTTVLVFLSLHIKEYFEYFIRQLRLFWLYTVSWRASFWKFFVSRCCFRLGNSISTPYLLIYFEGIGFLRIERHLAGLLTVRNKSITEKF